MVKNDDECYVKTTALICIRFLMAVPELWTGTLQRQTIIVRKEQQQQQQNNHLLLNTISGSRYKNITISAR